MIKNGFTKCAEMYISSLRKEGRFSTAHVYECAILSFTTFYGTRNIAFEQINRETLRCYEIHLYERGLMPNSISTYMRMLRSIYNQGVERGKARYVPRLFREVYTGVDNRQKKALPIDDLHRLLYDDPKEESLRKTQSIATLMFQFCGMSFADITHLEKASLKGDILYYNRVKTKTPVSVEVLDSMREIMGCLRSNKPAHKDCPDYLFAILKGDKEYKDERAYREYQSALRAFNNHLKMLAKRLHINHRVSSYTLRHSWATTAKYRGVSIEMISESLGHQSIKTTQTYLKGFELKERTRVNKMNLCYVKNFKRSKSMNVIC